MEVTALSRPDPHRRDLRTHDNDDFEASPLSVSTPPDDPEWTRVKSLSREELHRELEEKNLLEDVDRILEWIRTLGEPRKGPEEEKKTARSRKGELDTEGE